MTIAAKNILTRHPKNPIISTDDYPQYYQIFNPSPVMYNGKTILLLSIIPFKGTRLGVTKVAESDDGINFAIRDESFIDLSDQPEPYNGCYHFIDNRTTKIGDTYYILTPVGAPAGTAGSGPVTIMGTTNDFKKYEFKGMVALPPQRGASLFPEQINGKYWRLNRPGAGDTAKGSIWIDESPDLVHWGNPFPIMHPGMFGPWSGSKIGPTPPIKTSEGWLFITHGVSGALGIMQYHVGAALLDLNNPRKVKGYTTSYLLAPEMPYEIHGAAPNVCFPCGALADEDKDELRLYYGAADTRIALATGSLDAVIRACIDKV